MSARVRPRSTLHGLGVLALLLAPAGHAAVSCTVSATAVAFGNYNPLQATPDASTGALAVTCSATGSPATVSLNVTLSTGLSGTYSPRRMFSGSNTLNYNLYFSTAYTQIWGDGTGGTFRGTATLFVPTGGSRTARGTMYGMIPALQDPAAGSYADSIVVTVTY